MENTTRIERLQVTDYQIFYEVVDGALLRRMQPLELAYRRLGVGRTTLVCLHSLCGASETVVPLAEALDGRAQVIAVDLRGFGESHRPTQEYDVNVWVADIAKLVAATRLDEKPVLYGHGIGATVAIAAAQMGIASGIALSGVALAPGQPSALDELISVGDRGDDVTSTLLDAGCASVRETDVTPQIVARTARAWQAFDGRALVSRLGIPLLVIGGEVDHLTPVDAEGGGAWAAEHGDGVLARLPGGHDPCDRIERVADALVTWLDEWKE